MLQQRADALRTGRFTGVPIDDFERAGREQLVFMLMNGLTPGARVLDLGCGVLRAGYWLIHFLDAGRYCGIEPSTERLAIGTGTILEAGLAEEKRPRFDTNAEFDSSVFGERFDFFLAYSIWTHAAKRHIETMLDNFLRDSTDDGVFITTYLPSGWRQPDYDGEEWVGTSHESRVPGCIFHSLAWIEDQCRRRGLEVRPIGKDTTHGQSWLRIARIGRTPRIADIVLRAPEPPRALTLLRRIRRKLGQYSRRLSGGS